jgi:Xaa-Pro aminopeptidase
MSVHTPEEIHRVRLACEAGVWMHEQVPLLLRSGLTERELLESLESHFQVRWGHLAGGYEYEPAGVWDVRNPARDDSLMFHATVTDRPFTEGDLVFRGWSGVRYCGYPADVDRIWYLGRPPTEVLDLYRVTWECNRAMAQAIGPGSTCADVYAAGTQVERQSGLAERATGRTGHGLRNTGGLSVHPANHTVLEPGMIISVEPMFSTEHGFFDLEDQYLLTEMGAEVLHPPAPEHLPVIDP